MTHERQQQLRLRASDLNVAVSLLLAALERDIVVVNAQRQDAIGTSTPEDIQQLNEQQDRLSKDRGVLHDQVATLERLASGGARPGRETSALTYINELAQAFLLAVDDINARAKLLLTPTIIEQLPAWEVESARASVADAERVGTILSRILDP